MFCDHCGYEQDAARRNGSTHCEPPFTVQLHSFTGRHPADSAQPKKTFVAEPSPWHPMTDPIDLKHLGKFAEELGECTSAVARCMIQGIDECEPSTGEINRDWLTKEIADVICNVELVVEHFNLDWHKINERTVMKRHHLKRWHSYA